MPVNRTFWLRTALIGLAIVSVPLMAGCADWMMGGPQSIWRSEAIQGQEQADLFLWIILWAAIVAIAVYSALFFVLIRFRRRLNGELPKQIHGSTRLEIAWTIAPAFVLGIIAVPTVALIFQTYSPAPAGALEIKVLANQWFWQFEYPEYGFVTSNEPHLPVDRPVVFRLDSADVLHSFWIPRLGGKRDVVPNQNNFLNFTAKTPGEYGGQCAEFCGISHANMLFKVFVQTETDFQSWVTNQQRVALVPPVGTLAAQGAAIFSRSACIGCHDVRGTVANGNYAPDLTHFGSRTTLAAGILPNTKDNVFRWLRDPQVVKPGTLMPNLNLSRDDATALAEYLDSLK